MQPLRRDVGPAGGPQSAAETRQELIKLIRARSFGRGKIKLVSGRETDFYFDLRPTTLHPAGATYIGSMIVDALAGIEAEYVGGLEMGAIPIATAVAIAAHARGRDLGAFFVRKKPKEYGAQKLVEGLPRGTTLQGKKVVVVEDVTTTGGSAIQAALALREEGAEVVLVLTIVDRLEGAAENFAAENLPFRALLTVEDFLEGS